MESRLLPAIIVGPRRSPKTSANPMIVVVRDSGGNAVPGVTVTFTAPSSGASGNFAGSSIATAVTIPNGQATAPAFSANSIAGSYSVIASAPGVSTTASFPMTNTVGLGITTSSVAPATQSQPYQQQLTAFGGTPPYTWSLVTGSLPGLTLAPSGVITGTPTTSGTFPFTARVRDSSNAIVDQTFSLAVAGSLALSTCPASTGIVGQAYSSNAVATGGTTPYTWSFTTGAFPPGLVLNALTGAVKNTHQLRHFRGNSARH